ncbi:MAG: TolC family outer membrane protein [Desulfovibrionaceae bacterium]|nr:TolC family outer membrane protein [Desulfovibrionaceae bacterium]
MLRWLVLLIVIGLSVPAQGMAKEPQWPAPPPPGKSLEIEDTVYGVLRHHRNLRGIQENREVLEHELRRAQAGFGPRVDLEGRAGGSIYSDASTRATDLDGTMYGYVSASARLVQPIWDGFATRSRVREAQSTLNSMRHRVFDTATSLALDGIIAHIDLLRRRIIYDLAIDNIRQHKEILAQAQERATLGADTEADVTQTQSRLARAESNLSEAKAALLVAEHTYRRLTGLEPKKLKPVTMPPDLFANTSKIFELAQKSNPKLAAYLQDIRAARARRELAEAEFYPELNLEAGPSYTDRGGATDRWIYSFDVLGTMRWNIFNSGADVAERKAASARMRQARQEMRDYIDTLKLDIETTWTNYQAAQEQYKHYSQAVEYNKYTRVAYIEQFSIGKRSLLDVLDTINELYNSSTQAETARSNVLVGAYRLSGLTGNLLPSMSINTKPLDSSVPRDKHDKREEFKPAWFK